MMHHLDPRQAGTGAAPDVEITRGPLVPGEPFGAYRPDGARLATGDTEAAALHAARDAAGFGHVAERACDAIEREAGYHYDSDGECVFCGWDFHSHTGRRAHACDCYLDLPSYESTESLAPHDPGPCITCAWPRDAHGTTEARARG
jgi:hypothetical protein